MKGLGLTVPVTITNMTLAPNRAKTLRMYISGSSKNAKEAEHNTVHAKENIKELFFAKKERYAKIEATAKITVPDTLLMKAYRWGKYNTDWMIRDVPDMGRGINAGLPDYPWFFSNDQAITFKALVGTLDPSLFYDSWEMMKRISDEYNKGSGQIIHEVSTNGAVYDEGRMEESQLFVGAAWEIFKWYGDIDFLRTYYEHGKKTWEFLQKNDIDNDLYVEGYGGIEIEGLNDEMLDVAVETYAFLHIMSQAAKVLGETDYVKLYEEKATALKLKINEDWWSPSENRYADFIADKEKALELIDMALEKRVKKGRNEWARTKLLALKKQIASGKYGEKGYTVFYNASALAPLKEGIADSVKAQKTLDGMSDFTNKFGIYIAGIAKPDDMTSEEGSVAHRLKGDFNYDEAIMIAGTAPLAIAATKYQGIDKGMKYIDQILNNFSFATPRTMYEVSPDYGMFVQAWNVSGINIPLIHYVFGIDPFAYEKRLTINPDIPSDWEFAQLENLLVGDNSISMDYERSKGSEKYIINSEHKGWSIHFKIPEGTKRAKVNGKKVAMENDFILLKETSNTLEFSFQEGL